MPSPSWLIQMRKRLANALAAFWGLAEATVFFIVPDVLLSWLALRGLRPALLACLYALAGALVGGTAIWVIAQQDPEYLRQLYMRIPAIDAAMLGNVQSQLEATGLIALFIGPLIGTPYKIYALEAAVLELGFIAFLLVSIPARLIRFVLVASIVAFLNRGLARRLSLRQRQGLLLACWTGFYAWYFHVMGTA